MLNVKDFGALGDGVTDDTAPIQSALDAAGAGRVRFPAGEYLVTSLTVPSGCNLIGDGFQASRLLRRTDTTILNAAGAVKQVGQMPDIYGVVVSDLAIYNGLPYSTAPLVKLTGATACQFDRVKLESYSDGAPLLEALQLWDSRFNNVMFHGGGSNIAGKGAVRLLSEQEGYRHTMETFFNGCWWESYYGPGIECTKGAGVTSKTRVMQFNNCKMESRYSTTSHLILEVQDVQFQNFYVTHERNAAPVVDMRNARGVYGAIRFYQIVSPDAVTPSALVALDEKCRYVDLDIYVSEPQPAGQNVVTLANFADPTIHLRINADRPTINGTQGKTHELPYSNVMQAVNAGTGTCQYTWAREGRPTWSLGNPTNPVGTLEQFYLRANGTNFLRFQSDGHNPAASTRRVQVNAMLELGAEWNAPNLLRLGQYALWVDQAGVLRSKKGLPTRDDDGVPV
jgi:hypothetical protein